MKNLLKLICLLLLVGSCNPDETPMDPMDDPVDPMDPNPVLEYEGYTLEWADEFAENIDPLNWVYELGDGSDYGLPAGWGNNELQLYSNAAENAAIIADGDHSVLAITAIEEGGNYTSAKLTTQGLQSFRFGRIEARVKVPTGQGLWPAFWLLGEAITEVEWPGCGELDILEVLGNAPEKVYSSAHYTNGEKKLQSQTESLTEAQSLADDYHLYRMDWNDQNIVFSIDEKVIHTFTIEADAKEFLRPFYLIFNVAVGGNWPGNPNGSTVFPQQMLIDWVRYYKQDDFTAPAIPELIVEEETLDNVSTGIAVHAFNSDKMQFVNSLIKKFGAGGEPEISTSAMSIDGDSSLLFAFPGNSWGGAWFEASAGQDYSAFADGHLYFSINAPVDLADMEIKLESASTNKSLFLIDYTGTAVDNGFVEYQIPMADFEGLDLTDLKIPIALWNPVFASGDEFIGDVFLDNVYIE